MPNAQNVKLGDVASDECHEGVIVVSPDMISIRGGITIRAWDWAIEPGAHSTLADSEREHMVPFCSI
jgi:hypothetical protein